MLMRPIDLTTDHTAYNPNEATAVIRRCNNAPKAISSASSGGIKRVAGSLAVTRALGDAYLKTPHLSFFPYKRHAPYITGRPEVNYRILTKGADRILTLATDGVWERASGDDVLRWVRKYYNAHIAGVKEQHLRYGDSMLEVELAENAAEENRQPRRTHGLSMNTEDDDALPISEEHNGIAQDLTPSVDNTSKIHPGNISSEKKLNDLDASTNTVNETTSATHSATKGIATRNLSATDNVSPRSANSKMRPSRGRGARAGGATKFFPRAQNWHQHHICSSSSSRTSSLTIPTVSDVIIRKVLGKVRKTRNISSLRMLTSLPKGRARRSKHDDITASVVDLSGFIS